MKKINFILILVVISAMYSCGKDDDSTEIKNSSENGFTFNSEFFPTDKLLVSGDPGALYFLIIDDTSEFNTVTRAYEGDPGQIIFLEVPLQLEEQVDFVRTYTNAVQSFSEDMTDVSFAAALVKDVSSVESIFIGDDVDTDRLLIANTGDITVNFDSETSVFTLDYTFSTNEGSITGFHESEFILIQ